MLKRRPHRLLGADGLGTIPGNAERDEVERIRLGGLDGGEEFLGIEQLLRAEVTRCERKLPGERSETVDAIAGHAIFHYPLTWANRQERSRRCQRECDRS